MISLEDQAIQAALTNSWKHAIEINTEIIAANPKNIDAMSRLAYAYSQYGKYKKACKIYRELLKIEPYNPIAQRNLAKCEHFDRDNNSLNKMIHKTSSIRPSLFVADAQKTRIVQLVDVASQSVLSSITIGETVLPFRKGFELHIRTNNDVYLGKLPDDIGRKLMVILQKNNVCNCVIKNLDENGLTIFIKWQG